MIETKVLRNAYKLVEDRKLKKPKRMPPEPSEQVLFLDEYPPAEPASPETFGLDAYDARLVEVALISHENWGLTNQTDRDHISDLIRAITAWQGNRKS